MTTKIYSVSDTQSKIQVDGVDAVIVDKVGGISSGVKASAISGLTVTQANQTPLPTLVSTLMSFTHGLGAIPFSAELELVCLTAEAGFTIGDTISNACVNPASGLVVTPIITKTATTAEARTGTNTGTFYITNKTTGGQVVPTAANWAWRFKVRAV